MKKILFPTDFSANANNAFNYALHLAAKLGADIITLHAYKMPQIHVAHLPNTAYQIMEQQTENEFAQYQKAAQEMHEQAENEHLSQVNIIHMLEEGLTVDKILEVSEKENVDIIVLGTTGATGLKQVFLGSNAARVIDFAKCPVLAIPDSARYSSIKRIAYACSFEKIEKKHIEEAISFTRLFNNAELHLIHADTTHTYIGEKRMNQLRSEYSQFNDIFFHVIDTLDVIEGVDFYVQNNDIDILAMFTHHRNFLEKLVTVSYTQQMAYQTKTPLLALH